MLLCRRTHRNLFGAGEGAPSPVPIKTSGCHFDLKAALTRARLDAIAVQEKAS